MPPGVPDRQAQDQLPPQVSFQQHPAAGAGDQGPAGGAEGQLPGAGVEGPAAGVPSDPRSSRGGPGDGSQAAGYVLQARLS